MVTNNTPAPRSPPAPAPIEVAIAPWFDVGATRDAPNRTELDEYATGLGLLFASITVGKDPDEVIERVAILDPRA